MKNSTTSDCRVKKTKRLKKACENCRRRKIKCSGSNPCMNCITSELKCVRKLHTQNSDEAFFKSPTELKHEVCSLKKSLAELSTNLSSANTQNLKFSLNRAVSALENINLEYVTELQHEAIKNYDGGTSIETAMVNNPVLFEFFAAGIGTNVNMSIDKFFGLYSPLVYYSPHGLGYLMTKLLKIRDNIDTRLTLYLILKLLDLGTSLLLDVSKRDSHDFDFSAQLKTILHILPNGSSSEHFQFQTKKVKTSHDMLEASSKLLEYVQSVFGRLEQNKGSLNLYLNVLDKLASLSCKSFYLSAFATFETICPETLVEVIEKVYWILDVNIAGKLIALLCRRLLDLGYGRWEYNYGIGEKLADQNRITWWRGLWWDRWYALSTGKLPLLSEEMSNCLFPRAVMLLKVDDEMDCLTLAREVDLQDSNLEVSLFFGYILLTKVISFAFSSVLYNKAFAAYRRDSNGTWKDPSGTLAILKSYYDQIEETFRFSHTKVISVLELNMEDQRCQQLGTFIKLTKVTIYQAMCALLKRLQKCSPQTYLSCFDGLIAEITDRSVESSVSALSALLDSDSIQMLLQHIRPLVISLLNITSQMISQREVPDEDSEKLLGKISVMCRLCERFKDVYDVLGASSGENSFLRKSLLLGTISSFIFTRMCCQACMGLLRKTKEEFFIDLKVINIHILETARNVMDVKCSVYMDLYRSEQQSYLTECVLKYSELQVDDLKQHADRFLDNGMGRKDVHFAKPDFFAKLPENLTDDAQFDLFISSLDSVDLSSMFRNEFSN